MYVYAGGARQGAGTARRTQRRRKTEASNESRVRARSFGSRRASARVAFELRKKDPERRETPTKSESNVRPANTGGPPRHASRSRPPPGGAGEPPIQCDERGDAADAERRALPRHDRGPGQAHERRLPPLPQAE